MYAPFRLPPLDLTQIHFEAEDSFEDADMLDDLFDTIHLEIKGVRDVLDPGLETLKSYTFEFTGNFRLASKGVFYEKEQQDFILKIDEHFSKKIEFLRPTFVEGNRTQVQFSNYVEDIFPEKIVLILGKAFALKELILLEKDLFEGIYQI